MKLKLNANDEQKKILLETMITFNAACNYVSEVAAKEGKTGQISLHKLCYYDIRKKFNLPSQIAVRVIGKVAEAYKTIKKPRHLNFKPYGAIAYDRRIWKFKQADRINLKTLDARIDIPFTFYNYRNVDFRRTRGQADLIYQDGQFYFCICVDVPEPPPDETDDFIGIDLGIVNIATDSDGVVSSGSHINSLRNRNARLISKLQSKGTKSAKHLLKKRKRQESRFRNDVNHCISKSIVGKAKRTCRGIAIENLKGIRNRIRVKKSQRRQQHSWSFYDLRQKLEYKAKLAGAKLVAVDPRYTSQMCSQCGYVSKRNRPNQSTFSCQSCGFSANADWNAAINIANRGAVVNQPNVVSVETKAPIQLMLFPSNCGGA